LPDAAGPAYPKVMSDSKRTRAGGWLHAACALALLCVTGPARAEREPAALARARAHATAEPEPDSVAGSEGEPETDDPLDQPPPDEANEAEGGGDAEPAAEDEAESVRDAASHDERTRSTATKSTRARAQKPAREAPPAPAPAHDAQPTRSLPSPLVAPSPSEPPAFEHVVAEHETLGAIAAHYDLTVQALIEQNPGLDADRIRAGQHIVIDPDRKLVKYTVQPGDTLTGIAHAQRVSVAELQRWNPQLKPDRIRDGVSLRVFPRVPASPSVSIGTPSAGRLIAGRKLTAGLGFAVRSTDRAWGTDETVRELTAGFASLQRTFPGTPRVWVHDISLRGGGPIDDHHSHQSGRDADIAYVQRECSTGCGFHALGQSELDARRTWALLRYWLERDELEAVFIDYRLQAPLSRAARADGASDEELRRWFQYPRGRGNPWGVVRHYPKHGDHMHVRFACHSSDPECKTFRPLLTHTASR
jgi:LysM repeat protein